MKKSLRHKIIRIILIIEILSLGFCLLATTIYQLQKLENKSQLFLDASRSDYLTDDSRSLQQKIQLAVSGHEFKNITFAKDHMIVPPTSVSNITLSKPILSNTNDINSVNGYAYFTFSLVPALVEGLLAWLFISVIILLIIPLIQKYLEKQIRLDLETEQAKALAAMATQVAHDIRSPLSVIRMISAVPDLNTPDARELMNAAAVRIDEIAQDLVDTAKRNKITEIETETVDLTKLLFELTATKQVEFKNDSTVKINLQNTDQQKILANKKELSRILSNLINNSVEAKDKNEITIHLKTENHKNETVITLSDNGQGMSFETVNAILKGSHQSQKSGRSGLGLGLKHAIQTTQNMRGQFKIDSAPGQGTTIRLSFKKA